MSNGYWQVKSLDEIAAEKSVPFTFERYQELLHWWYCERKPVEPQVPAHTVDLELLHRHGIGHAFDGGYMLFSPDGMKKAREVGAVKDADHPTPG